MKFVFDGHDYTLEDGICYNALGHLVCSIDYDICGEYIAILNECGEYEGLESHINNTTELDMVKSFISGSY